MHPRRDVCPWSDNESSWRNIGIPENNKSNGMLMNYACACTWEMWDHELMIYIGL